MAAENSTEIANMSLAHNAVGDQIGDLDTDTSQEAIVCRRFYLPSLRKILTDWDWPFATKMAALGLVAEDPNIEWLYSYRYPSDCLKFRRILNGYPVETRDTVIPTKVGSDGSGLLIFTNQEDASAEYTFLVTNTALFPNGFDLALSYLLASFTAPSLTGGKSKQYQEANLALYRLHLASAMANAAQEERPDLPPEADVIRAREG